MTRRKKNKKLSMEKKDEVVRLLKRTTFNLAAENWKQKSLQGRSLRADWKQEINFLEDYIGGEASR